MDGTLVEAWASLKSFKKKDGWDQEPPDDPGNPTVNFHGEKRRNDTHQSTTDPDALLYTKGSGKEAKLYYMGHAVMENRNGLVVGGQVPQATGTAEREAALQLIENIPRRTRITLAGDNGYDTRDFVKGLREADVTPTLPGNSATARSTGGRPSIPVTTSANKSGSEWKRSSDG